MSNAPTTNYYPILKYQILSPMPYITIIPGTSNLCLSKIGRQYLCRIRRIHFFRKHQPDLFRSQVPYFKSLFSRFRPERTIRTVIQYRTSLCPFWITRYNSHVPETNRCTFKKEILRKRKTVSYRRISHFHYSKWKLYKTTHGATISYQCKNRNILRVRIFIGQILSIKYNRLFTNQSGQKLIPVGYGIITFWKKYIKQLYDFPSQEIASR